MASDRAAEHGRTPRRADVRPPLRPFRLLLSLLVNAASVFLAAAILPRFDVGDFWSALAAALIIAALNAVLAPLVSAVRLPYTVATSFLLILILDAALLRAADALTGDARSAPSKPAAASALRVSGQTSAAASHSASSSSPSGPSSASPISARISDSVSAAG